LASFSHGAAERGIQIVEPDTEARLGVLRGWNRQRHNASREIGEHAGIDQSHANTQHHRDLGVVSAGVGNTRPRVGVGVPFEPFLVRQPVHLTSSSVEVIR